MYKKGIFTIESNNQIAKSTYKMVLVGDTQYITKPGQFINIKLDGKYLRRPISVSDLNQNKLTIVYKVVGSGTEQMRLDKPNKEYDVLSGLGNGFNVENSGANPLLIGGGVGVPPLYNLAKILIEQGKTVNVILGFNSSDEIFYEKEFKELGCEVYVTTVDGSVGIKGFVTNAMQDLNYTYTYSCGPEPMLKAVYNQSKTSGEYSFESRMGCGFGACMGCSCKTKYGNKRICKDGPVLTKEEIIW